MLLEKHNGKNRDYNRNHEIEKKRRKTRVDIFDLSHLTAGMASVPVYSQFSNGPLTCGIKPLDTDDECLQIEKRGIEAEITDYAILQGGEYWEVENSDKTEVKRLGSYWTDTTVELAEPSPEISPIKSINTYHMKKVETCYTFYGYEKGEKCEKNTEPCIVELVYADGTMLFLNENGNLFNLSKDWNYLSEATIGHSESPLVYRPTPKIYFYSKGACVGSTDKIIKYYDEMIEKEKIVKKLTEGKYKYVGGRNYSNIVEVSNCRIGIRPVIKSYNFAAIDIIPEDDIKSVPFTEFPQTVVLSETQKSLEKLYKKGKLNLTGKSYPTSSGEQTKEYEFNGKKYVRVIAKLCESNIPAKLSNGCKYNNGDVAWVLVEPVNLLVNNDNMTSVCEKIIFAGVPYNQTIKIDAITCYRSSQFAAALLNDAEQYIFTNCYNIVSRIVSGTEWMRSYCALKDRYAKEQIPFEETEKQAAERYIKEYEKLKQYCQTNKLNMEFSEYNPSQSFKSIGYSYRPSIEFLNSIENPEVAILAALGPKDVWNSVYFREYLKAYGTWAINILKEENIKNMAGKIYDEKLEKSMIKIKK